MSESLLSPGDVIDDRYEIVSLLGVGGMGEVFKVRHQTLETFRTIKVMRQDLLKDEENRKRFLREARIATRVQHPNVAILHDFSRLPDGSYYMVSEFIDGITIRQWLESHVRFRPDVAIEVALQVLQGLDHCHRAGLLHRDISAVNIMIAAGSIADAVVAKIIDMGIAKIVEGPSTGDGTRVGLFVGNPRYASPEQWGALEEDELLDGRADLYCFGIVLYEMLTGRAPFTSKTALGYGPKHLAEPPPPFSRAAPGVEISARLEDVVMKALQKRRDDRWPDARAFARALEPLRGDQLMGTMRMRLESIASRRNAGDFSPLPAASQGQVSPTVTGDRLALPVQPLDSTTPVAAQASHESPPTFPVLPTESLEEREARAWDEAAAKGSAHGWSLYLEEFQGSSRREEAEQLHEEARDFEALSQEDPSALRAFLEHWPKGVRASEASAALAESEGAATRALDAARDVPALKRFLRDHPASLLRPVAERRLEEWSAFARAAELDTVVGWDQFLERWPVGEKAVAAKERLAAATSREDERAFTIALAANSIASFTLYVERHPAGSRVREAGAAIAELQDFERSSKAGTPDALRSYLARHGEGPNAPAATAALRALEAEAHRRASAGVEAECADFLRSFPDSPNAAAISERARSLRVAREYEAAMADGSDRALQSFIAAHPGTSQAESARAILDERSRYASAMSTGTPSALRQYLADHPAGTNAALAAARLRQLQSAAYERATTGDERAALHFLEEFPEDPRAGEIRSRLREKGDGRLAEASKSAASAGDFRAAAAQAEKIVDAALRESVRALIADAEDAADWTTVETDGGAAAYKRYLRQRSSGRWAAVARERLEDLEQLQSVDKLAQQGNAAELERLAESAREPVATRARESAARLRQDERERLLAEEQAWTRAASSGTSQSWEEYLRTHRGAHRAEAAHNAKAEAGAFEDALRRNRPGDWKKFLARHPDGAHRGDAEMRLAAFAAAREQTLPASTTETRPEARSAIGTRRALVAAALVLGLVVASLAVWKWSQTRRPEVVATGMLVVDARPWAEIVSIRDAAGKEWLAAAGETTPFHLSLPAGSYEVSLKGPDSRIAPVRAEITASSTRAVTYEFARVDVDVYLKAAGW